VLDVQTLTATSDMNFLSHDSTAPDRRLRGPASTRQTRPSERPTTESRGQASTSTALVELMKELVLLVLEPRLALCHHVVAPTPRRVSPNAGSATSLRSARDR
jgi:hypothetical protein